MAQGKWGSRETKSFPFESNEKRDWRLELNKYLLAYRSTQHITTGQSPAELLFGRKLSTKLLEVADLEESEDPGYQQARDRDVEKKNRLGQTMLTRSIR